MENENRTRKPSFSSLPSVQSLRSSEQKKTKVTKTLPDRLREATKPAMIAVAPGKFVPNRTNEPPECSLCSWQGNGDGTFSPIPQAERMVRINSKLMRLLGFDGQWSTVTRLARAGFIETVQLAPHCTMLNLNSWYGHLRRCAETEDFWNPKGENYRHYVRYMF